MKNNTEHYHHSDRFPGRDSRLWQNSQEIIASISSDSALTFNEDYVLVNTTSTVVNLDLPPARNGHKFTIIRISGANNIVVTPSGSETIDGASSKTISSSYSPVRLKAVTGVGYISV